MASILHFIEFSNFFYYTRAIVRLFHAFKTGKSKKTQYLDLNQGVLKSPGILRCPLHNALKYII